VKPGDVALVHAAAGGVGQLLVQMITAKGATVVATAGSDEKLEIARGRGAAHTINYATTQDLSGAVREAVGRGVDVVYDGVGKATFDESLKSLRRRGMMVLFGGASGQVAPFDIQRLNQLGSLYVTRPKVADYVAEREEFEWRAREVFADIAEGRLHLEIGGRYALADAADAYEALEGRRTTGKLILVPGE
jgi:NADPH2:quinone reductase